MSSGMTSVVIVSLFSVFGAHALAYLFINVLPDAAIIALGIDSVQSSLVSAFQASHEARSYPQIFNDLIHFELGMTLDGVSVNQELYQALSASMPRLLIAFLFILFLTFVTALFLPVNGKAYQLGIKFTSFIAFLPPYLIPFIGLLVVLSVQISGVILTQCGTFFVTVLAISIVPAALIVTQCLIINRRNLDSDFAFTLMSLGASNFYIRFRLLHNLFSEISPSIEKMFSGMLTAILFVEPVLGLNGFGTMAVRAIRRSDADLILAVTLITAMAISLLRILSAIIRQHYGYKV